MYPNRRAFLRAAGSAAIASAASPILGANDTVNIAVIGLGGRGRDHINEYLNVANCRIAALCDVNQAALERAQAIVQKARGYTPTGYSDMRQAFADKSLDAVSMPTPNHWHALGSIWACQAGKHVYVEKPACHNVWEGRKMIEAARKYKRVVQVGSQSRTTKHKIRAIELLKQGVIGDVYLAKGLCYKRRKSIGRKPDGPVPPGLNWDMFLGPAPMRPFNENRFAYNWHWFWDTGNGDIGNQGVHEMDIARWGLGVGLPKSVVATGGKFVYDDDQETPNTELATFDYGKQQIVFEVRGLPTGEDSGIVRDSSGNVIGNVFYGSDGLMSVDMAGFRVFRGDKGEKIMEEKFAEKKSWDTNPHMTNFIEAVRSGDPKLATADVEIGVTSATLCHLANISYRTGRKLEFDAAAWQFRNDAEANAMLTRKYRAPYVVPDKV
jgi:predicted dehydrogenase